MSAMTLMNALLRNTYLWRLILILSLIGILFLATTSQPYPIPSSGNDKINHVLAFVQLTLVSRLAWPGARPGILVAVLLGYGLSIELIQGQLPYRYFSLADLLADAVGIAIGCLPWPGVGSRASDRPSAPPAN
ncbi:VanZ family protein [Marinobacter sp. X15-166B]|uniref:VanZ family protein n=1 Tax=Marinobacter sp. X15-166B TaxID=1897620 RepID=UPI00085CAC5A|nr:VanZ family protein [Marinobacter sp. X15-166B]OEY65776.1 hypothetical protein BG841_04445 [Marinobacter sp. X15-166B]